MDVYADSMAFRTIRSLEFYNYTSGAWEVWAEETGEELLDGNSQTSLVANKDHATFRITIQATTYLYAGMVFVEQDWDYGLPGGTSGSKGFDISIETDSTSAFTTPTSIKNGSYNTYASGSINRLLFLNGHTPDPYWRFIINASDDVDDVDEELRIVNLKMLVSGNLGRSSFRGEPWQYFHNKTVLFDEDIVADNIRASEDIDAVGDINLYGNVIGVGSTQREIQTGSRSSTTAENNKLCTFNSGTIEYCNTLARINSKWYNFIYSPSNANIGWGTYVTDANSQANYVKALWTDLSTLKTTNEGDLFVVGDLNATNNITGNQIYGGMWYHNHTATQLNFAVDGKYYYLFLVNSTHLNGFSHEGNNFFDSSNLTAQVDGTYKVEYMASGDGQNNHEYYTSVFVNEENQYNCEFHHKMASGGDIITQSGSCFISLSVNDKISLRTADVGGTGTGNYYSGNLNLIRVGDKNE